MDQPSDAEVLAALDFHPPCENPEIPNCPNEAEYLVQVVPDCCGQGWQTQMCSLCYQLFKLRRRKPGCRNGHTLKSGQRPGLTIEVWRIGEQP